MKIIRKLKKFIPRTYFTAFFIYVLVIFYFFAFFADIFAPYNPDTEFRQFSYAPPSSIEFFDEEGSFHFFPFVYGVEKSFDEYRNKIYAINPTIKGNFSFMIPSEKYYLFGVIPLEHKLFGFHFRENNGAYFMLGADARGRDIFSRILYGGRVSLTIGILGSFITFFIGIFLGAVSGYFGGKIDSIIMRICEAILLIPSIYLLFALRAVFPLDMTSIEVYFLIVFILSFLSWASLTRIIRGLVLNIAQQEYVQAARALGQSHFRIIVYHIIPNTFSYSIVAVTLAIPMYILAESTLSFLGLGIQDPAVSWGYMLADASKISELQFHPWILFPGVCITLTVVGFNVIGDWLRDKYDPNLTIDN